MEVHIRQGTVNTYRQVLREIKQRDINNIIVDTRTEHVHIFFRAVSQKKDLAKQNKKQNKTKQTIRTSVPFFSLVDLFVDHVSLDRVSPTKKKGKSRNRMEGNSSWSLQ